MTERTPYDSMPFYCRYCGGEFGVECESQCCELEEEWRAEQRAWLHAQEDGTELAEAAE